MKRNWLATIILTILLVSSAFPLLALPISASDDNHNDDEVKITPGTWYKLESDIVTVLFPSDGRKPMFIWWYTGKPDQVYVVKYQGLIEYFAFDKLGMRPEFYKRMHEALYENLHELYFKEKEDYYERMGDQENMMRLMQLQTLLMQIYENWHSPFLPFNEGRWNLSDIHYVTSEGKTVGIAFAFTLVEVHRPRFEFAENNIMIRVRFYNSTVEETVPGTNTKYTVNPGEMKMDLVVKDWKWNIDLLKPLFRTLRDQYGIDVPEGRARLALWINLASINITRLPIAKEEPEQIEESTYSEHSYVASHMSVEGEREYEHMSIEQNQTMMGEEEKPLLIDRPIIKLKFLNQTETLAGFFRFVASAKVTNFPQPGNVTVPVKAAYIAAGAHMRLFIGYPYFGNGTLEHDPSIGVDVPGVDTTPKYSVQAPSGSEITPIVLGKYVLPLFTPELMVALIAIVSGTAILLYAFKWKRKTPVNMVGAGTTG